MASSGEVLIKANTADEEKRVARRSQHGPARDAAGSERHPANFGGRADYSRTVNMLCSDRYTDIGEGATDQSTWLDITVRPNR